MKTGRPTFRIDPARLRALRDEAGFSQLAVARLAYQSLDKPASTADRTMVNHYKRIEKDGRTSRPMAQALASILDVSIPVLQGEAPDDALESVARVEQQLREQLNTETNLALQQALDRDTSADDPIRELAVDIAARIEAAQIGSQTAELVRLAELTGWTEAELLHPVNVHGHWLLLSTIRGGCSTEIVHGAGEVLQKIQTELGKWTSRSGSDATIAMREELPWIHVDVTHPRIQALHCRFSFVRCQPHRTGLLWTNPSWRDRFWLDGPLESWAYGSFNFVSRFRGEMIPQDVRRLRLLIEEVPTPDTVRELALVAGNLAELPPTVLRNFQDDGHSHDLVTNWLANGLWPALQPHLKAWPLDCWSIRIGACIDLMLDVPLALAIKRDAFRCSGFKFRARLVEVDELGQISRVPWHSASVATAGAVLQRDLDEARSTVAAMNS